MNIKVLFILLLLPFSFFAQVKMVKAKITDAGSLYSTYDFEADEGSLKELIKSQGGEKNLADIITYSQEGKWPEPINNFDTRMKHQSEITQYKVYKIVANSEYTVLLVPAKENKHMPAKLCPSRDIYLIFETVGVDFEGKANVPLAPERIETVSENDWGSEEDQDIIPAYISEPGDLYSGFDLAGNASAKAIFLESGALSAEEFSVLSGLVKEANWPAGISTLSKRLGVKEEMKKYNAEYVATFGENDEYTIIWISPEDNKHMPTDMQPDSEMGIYMVFKSTGIVFY